MLAMSSYAFYSAITVHVDGNIAMLGLYTDAACTIPLPTIHFVDIQPGSTATKDFYVKNFASTTTTLTLTVTNVSPTNLLTYASVSWNREGETLTTGMALSATLSMTISPEAVIGGPFEYDITVSTGEP